MERAKGPGSRTMSSSGGVPPACECVRHATGAHCRTGGLHSIDCLTVLEAGDREQGFSRLGGFLGLRGSLCASLLIPRGLLATVGVPGP